MSGVTYGCGHRTGGRAPSCPLCGNPDVVERCTCGSGAHPRRCAAHPDEYDRHISELECDVGCDAKGGGA